MATFDQGLIAEIKARLSIEDVVGQYVALHTVGNRLVAPCPFHQETKPSFSVNPERGFYYCFGCQASGDCLGNQVGELHCPWDAFRIVPASS